MQLRPHSFRPKYASRHPLHSANHSLLLNRYHGWTTTANVVVSGSHHWPLQLLPYNTIGGISRSRSRSRIVHPTAREIIRTVWGEKHSGESQRHINEFVPRGERLRSCFCFFVIYFFSHGVGKSSSGGSMALTVQTSLNAESSFAAGQVSEELLHNTSVDADPVLQATVGYSLPGEKFPDDPISSATMNLILTVVQAGILPVLTLGGVVMNVINMAVFVRQGLSDRINLLLFSLALSDTGYITNSMAYRLPSLFSLVDPTLAQFWMWKINRYVFIGIYMGFLSVSSCQTLLISLERCICVLWPLKAKTLLSVRRMAVVIVFIFVFCLGCCVLVIFKFKTVSLWDPTTNSTVYRTQPARFYLENRLLVGIVFDVIITLSIPTVCVGGVMLATIFISLRMRAVLSWRMQTAHVGTDKTETSSERRERLVTRMLMVVCIMFTACTLPSVFHGFFRFYMEEFELGRRYNNTFLVTICLVHGLASVNSSSNFLIYWTMSTKFRDTLRCLLVLLLHRRPARIE